MPGRGLKAWRGPGRQGQLYLLSYTGFLEKSMKRGAVPAAFCASDTAALILFAKLKPQGHDQQEDAQQGAQAGEKFGDEPLVE